MYKIAYQCITKIPYKKSESIISDFWVDPADHSYELFIVDWSVSVLVSELNHLVDLAAWKVLSDWSCNFLKLLSSKGSMAALVKSFKNSLKGSFVGWVSSKAEDFNKGAETELSSDSCSVDNAEDLSGLSFKVEGLDGVDEFIDGDVSAAVVVKDVEYLL